VADAARKELLMITTSIDVTVRPSAGPTLDPKRIEFGKTFTPNWFVTEFLNGEWQNPRVEPLRSLELHPAAEIFQYGQGIIEGLKAHRWSDGRIALFRPRDNAERFVRSAIRMDMPPVPPELFVEALKALVSVERNFVPPEPGTLYLRPTMIASEPCIGVRSAHEFMFYIIALPAGEYFRDGGRPPGSVSVYVAERTSRAAPGGTGNVKAVANYAISLKTITEAKAKGCAQVLFLNACGSRLIEEMGGMNVFFLDDEGLLTPPLTDTILPGITRESIISLAAELGIPVRQTPIGIDELCERILQGKVTEGFACGTAATIVGIGELVFETGRKVVLGAGRSGPVTAKLYDALQGIQFGRHPDKRGWTMTACETR
jgi:branched-chain amino acid aminotransferase